MCIFQTLRAGRYRDRDLRRLGNGAVGALAPASATPNVSTEITAVNDSSTAYFPAQHVNQAKEVEEHIQAF